MLKSLESLMGRSNEFEYVRKVFIPSNISIEDGERAVMHVKRYLTDDTAVGIDKAIFNKIVELSGLNIKGAVVCSMNVNLGKDEQGDVIRGCAHGTPLLLGDDVAWHIETAKSFVLLSHNDKSVRFVGLVMDALHELRHVKQYEDNSIRKEWYDLEYWVRPHEVEARYYSYTKLIEIWPSLLSYILNDLIKDI